MAKNDARFPTVGASHHHAPGNSPELPDLVPSGPSTGARVKRATTVPFASPPGAPRRRRATGAVLSVAFWLALLLGGTALIVAATRADERAGQSLSDPATRSEAYLAAVEEFRTAWTATTISEVGTTSIDITLENKYDEFSQTPRAYQALAQQCIALDATRSRFDDLSAAPPPPPVASAQLSDDPHLTARVDEATVSIAPLVASANELLTEGAAQLDALSTLCDSLTRLQPIADARASETAASITPLMVPPGASEQVSTADGTVEFACLGEIPCQPLASPAREAYGVATSAANTRFDTAAADFYSSHCPASALSEYCALASDLWSQRAAVDTESKARFAKETPLNSSVPLPEYTAWLETTSADLSARGAVLDSWMATYSGGILPAPGDNAFVTAVSAAAESAESRFTELRAAASAAASSMSEASSSTVSPDN